MGLIGVDMQKSGIYAFAHYLTLRNGLEISQTIEKSGVGPSKNK